MVFSIFVAKLNPFFVQRRRFGLAPAYAGTVAVFLWVCSHFYLPGQAFTYLVEFGAKQESRYIPELRAIDHYDLPDTYGYDGQYYAQIAMRPHLGDPVLRRAIDNLPYRARRILFCWTAAALGGGDPARALDVFAVQNIVMWLVLAALLLRWFPPVSWGNWVRWAGVLASFGLCVSVRASLMDGPSLALLAGGMALLECGRPWLAAAVLGVSGLGKETNALAAVAFVPGDRTRPGWLRALARGALVLLPLAVWLAVLTWRFGRAGETGVRNFAPPFVGYLRQCGAVARLVAHGPAPLARGSAVIQIALTAQWLFFALRPRWSEAWWRVGAATAALMVVLGDAVWEGYPSAIARVALPMTLAFNVLVPRGRGWWVVLLLGNLSVVASPKLLLPPGRESFRCEAPAALRPAPGRGPAVDAVFDDTWYPPERSWLEYWRWTAGNATVVFRNPHPYALRADFSFGLHAGDRRSVAVRDAAGVVWEGQLEAGVVRRVELANVRLEPGDTTWRFTTDVPPVTTSGELARKLAFSLRNLDIKVTGRASPPP
jgi:hypothetical protein